MREIELRDKYTLTVKEASQYFGIGENKIRRIAEENPRESWILLNGNRLLIKRILFQNYIDKLDVI